MSNKNISILFTGQGSQAADMGLDLIEKFEWVKKRYVISSEILGFDVLKAQADPNKLNLTEYSQPLIFIYSSILIDLFKKFQEKTISNNNLFLAGHSLGEYSALYFADALNYEEMLSLVNLRGSSMARVSDPNKYGMYAILTKEKINKEIFNERVFLANLNSEKQIVICGHKEDLIDFKEKNPIGRYIPLNVSAPFHSPLMKKSSEVFLDKAKNFNFKQIEYNLFSNHKILNYKDIHYSDYPSQLSKQIYSTVEWKDTITSFQDLNINDYYEIGPKKTLLNFLPKDEKINPYPFCTYQDINTYV